MTSNVGGRGGAVFLGANMEFTYQAQNQTIHAEQAAVINAWHHGADRIEAVAVSAAPCGHCRQFLFEAENSAAMGIITPPDSKGGYRRVLLKDLLPGAFAPSTLGGEARFMASSEGKRTLRWRAAEGDNVAAGAGTAAENSYAPYTHNYAGCAIQTGNGEIYCGRCVESAAHNPGVTALQCAIVSVHMACVDRVP